MLITLTSNASVSEEVIFEKGYIRLDASYFFLSAPKITVGKNALLAFTCSQGEKGQVTCDLIVDGLFVLEGGEKYGSTTVNDGGTARLIGGGLGDTKIVVNGSFYYSGTEGKLAAYKRESISGSGKLYLEKNSLDYTLDGDLEVYLSGAILFHEVVYVRLFSVSDGYVANDFKADEYNITGGYFLAAPAEPANGYTVVYVASEADDFKHNCHYKVVVDDSIVAEVSYEDENYAVNELSAAVSYVKSLGTGLKGIPKIVLVKDVTLEETVTIESGLVVRLDLDGYKIVTKADQAFIVAAGATLYLSDSSSDQRNVYYVDEDGLYVFNGGQSDWTERYNSAEEQGETGGVITGATRSGVRVEGTFMMEGGAIAGNSATSGGGVYVRTVLNGTKSTFVMNGGEIFGNTARSGEFVYSEGGSVSVNGGYVQGSASGCDVSETVYEITYFGGYFASDVKDQVADGRILVKIEDKELDEDFKDGYPYAVYREGELSLSAGTIVYDGSPVGGTDFTLSVTEGLNVVYWFSADGEQFVRGFPENAGSYTLRVVALDREEKIYYFDELKFEVLKVTPQVEVLAASDLVYDGQAQALVAEGTATFGEVLYSLSKDGEYTASIPAMTDAGECTMWYKVAESDNWNGTQAQSVTVTIKKATIDMSGVTFEGGTFTYDGTEKKIEIGGSLPAGVTVSYTGNALTNAGSSQATAVFAVDEKNYNPVPSMTATVEIEKADPVYEVPQGLEAVKGQTYAEVSLPQGWTWKEDFVKIDKAGTVTAVAVFTPEDTDNYNVTEVTLTLKVATFSAGAVAGIVIGSTLGALLIAYGVCAVLFKKRVVGGAVIAKFYPFIK